jgi:UDP-glucuronate 4-epimerase
MRRKSQRVLLTGGAGFIGSHVAEALLRRRVQLWILDNLDEFYSPALKKHNLEDIRSVGSFEFSQVDMCDRVCLRDAFERVRPDVVIHLAARAGVRPSIEQPHLYEQVNVAGTLNLLEMCRQFTVRKFVFGSSSSVYGATSQVPFSENQVELRPISVYAATKLAGEMLCYTYASLFALRVICLRFFTVYGPRQRPDLAIHKFTALIEAGKPVPIFGDGSAGRDYTWVDDIVAGVMAAFDYEPQPAGGIPFELFNLGNSHPVRLAKLLELLECITGKKAIVERHRPQPGDVPLTWADISKACRLLGYRPGMSLEKGLEQFVAWYRKGQSRAASA